VSLENNSRFILKRIIEHIQIVSGQILDGDISKIGLDIVLNSVSTAGQEGITPVVETIDLHIFVHKLANGDEFFRCALYLLRQGLRR